MTATRLATEREVGPLYDWLSRFNLLQNFLRFGRLRADLTMHKRLRLPEEAQTAYAEADACLYIHDQALAATDLPPEPHILDAGCGFGGTVFHWQQRLGGNYDGLTLSRVQWKTACREARRRGLTESCRFHQRSYDEPLDPASYDAVVVIEALIHSPCFAKTLANLVQALKPGGQLILVEDVVRDQAKADPDLDLMCEFWEIADLPTTSCYESEFDALGLRVLKDRDYSADFITSPPDQLADLATRYRRFLRIPLAGVRFIAGAFLGGIALERLYQKDLVQYRLIVAQKNT